MPRSVKRERVRFDVVEGGGIEPALDPRHRQWVHERLPTSSFRENKDFARERISVDRR